MVKTDGIQMTLDLGKKAALMNSLVAHKECLVVTAHGCLVAQEKWRILRYFNFNLTAFCIKILHYNSQLHI